MRGPGKVSAKIRKVLKVLGPGLVTGASDDDPSGIATYSQAGAQFGFNTLWTALLTFPLMAAIQGMCARIGLVTSQGLTVTLRQHYPRSILYLMLLFSFPAITLNIGADIQGMGAVANMLLPQVPASIFSIAFTIALMYIIIRYPYRKIARILKWLCASLFLYLIIPFMVHNDWAEILKKTFVPGFKFDRDSLSILVAILGTTISPYLFFWQATMEAEDLKHSKQNIVVDKQVLNNMREDVNIGMFLSNVVMFFIILTTGSVLFRAGIHKIETVDEAARALAPLTGRYAHLFFAIGVLGTGLLAIPVLAGSQAYMLAETFEWKAGLDKTFPQARPFYYSIILSLLVGLLLNFIGISPIQALFYTAVLYGITAPVLIAVILHIGNNKKIMGDKTNSALSNILGFITLILMTAAAVGLIVLSIG
ncbi:MAG: divalent metal cation transporter [Bacteroidetes bacterium]|nr:divalent metal cation transporter [Bacteroidota bacterium]